MNMHATYQGISKRCNFCRVYSKFQVFEDGNTSESSYEEIIEDDQFKSKAMFDKMMFILEKQVKVEIIGDNLAMEEKVG